MLVVFSPLLLGSSCSQAPLMELDFARHWIPLQTTLMIYQHSLLPGEIFAVLSFLLFSPFFLFFLFFSQILFAEFFCFLSHFLRTLTHDLPLLLLSSSNSINYVVDYNTTLDHFRYYLNVCIDLVPQNMANPSGGTCLLTIPSCQVDTYYNTSFPKNSGNLSYPYVLSGQLQLNYTGGDFCPEKNAYRSTHFTFTCNATAGVGYPVFLQEDCCCGYQFTWATKYACPTYCAVNQCQNGGSCHETLGNLTAGFNCSCAAGYTGRLCATRKSQQNKRIKTKQKIFNFFGFDSDQ